MTTRSLLTSITPIPASISRAAAVAQLHDHQAMIEVNPLVLRHELTTAPSGASKDEAEFGIWYEITDRINYLPGIKGEVAYKACFHNLPDGLQTHTFAPAGLDLRGKWRVGGNMPGEPREPRELGLEAPREGLYLREEIDMRCNFLLASFVKKTLRRAHHVSSELIIARASEAMATGAFPLQDASGAQVNPLGQVPTPGLGLDSYFPPSANMPPGAPFLSAAVPAGAPHSRPTQMQPAMAPMARARTRTHRAHNPDARYSLPPHCRCEGPIHLPTCPFFHPDDDRGGLSSSYPYDHPSQSYLQEDYRSLAQSPLAISAPQRRTTNHQHSASAISLPANALHELYGTLRADQCLCTGAIHNESCPGYPGLRTPGSITTPPATAESTTAPTQQSTHNTSNAPRPHHHQQQNQQQSQPLPHPSHPPSSTSQNPDISPLPVYAQLVAHASPPLRAVRQHFGDAAAVHVRPETPPSPPSPPVPVPGPGRALTHDLVFHQNSAGNGAGAGGVPLSLGGGGGPAGGLGEGGASADPGASGLAPRARTWSVMDPSGGGGGGGGPAGDRFVVYR